MVVYPKWHTERRNVTVGDVVVVQGSNCIRGEWRKAIVTKAHASIDGKVRCVKLIRSRKVSFHTELSFADSSCLSREK